MSGVRSLTRRATAVGYATPTSCPIYVKTTDNIPRCIPAGTGTTELPFVLATSTSGARIAAGVGTLVTGTLVITTGLTTVLSFVANPSGQPTGTGTASHQLLVPTWTTGAVTVTAYSVASVTGGTVAASTSTGSFDWLAVGI